MRWATPHRPARRWRDLVADFTLHQAGPPQPPRLPPPLQKGPPEPASTPRITPLHPPSLTTRPLHHQKDRSSPPLVPGRGARAQPRLGHVNVAGVPARLRRRRRCPVAAKTTRNRPQPSPPPLAAGRYPSGEPRAAPLFPLLCSPSGGGRCLRAVDRQINGRGCFPPVLKISEEIAKSWTLLL